MIREALIDVADTAHACVLWFKSEGIPPTADAVVAMTRLVLERADSVMVHLEDAPG